MRTVLLVLSLSAAAVTSSAADPIRFPDAVVVQPPTPLPPPRVDPAAPVPLPASEWYVIESDAPLLTFHSPPGRLTVTHDQGPVRLKGRFVNGAGRAETRVFDGPHVYTVEAAHPGPVELIVVPVGAKTEAEAVRRHLVSQGDPGPAPPQPPGPDPTPQPGPTPAPIPAPGFRVLIVYESGDLLPAAQLSVIDGRRVREYLTARCVKGPDGKTPEYRIWDKDVELTGESALWKAAMTRPRASVPWLVVSNGTTGWEGPLPKTADEALTILKTYGGE